MRGVSVSISLRWLRNMKKNCPKSNFGHLFFQAVEKLLAAFSFRFSRTLSAGLRRAASSLRSCRVSALRFPAGVAGFRYARRRGRPSVQEQAFLTAATQNIKKWPSF